VQISRFRCKKLGIQVEVAFPRITVLHVRVGHSGSAVDIGDDFPGNIIPKNGIRDERTGQVAVDGPPGVLAKSVVGEDGGRGIKVHAPAQGCRVVRNHRVGKDGSGLGREDSPAEVGGVAGNEEARQHWIGIIAPDASPLHRRTALEHAVVNGRGGTADDKGRRAVANGQAGNHRVGILQAVEIKTRSRALAIDNTVFRSVLRSNGDGFPVKINLPVSVPRVGSVPQDHFIAVRRIPEHPLDRRIVVGHVPGSAHGNGPDLGLGIRSSRARHRERHRIGAGKAKGMFRVLLRAGVSVPEIPGPGIHGSRRRILELNPEGRRAQSRGHGEIGNGRTRRVVLMGTHIHRAAGDAGIPAPVAGRDGRGAVGSRIDARRACRKPQIDPLEFWILLDIAFSGVAGRQVRVRHHGIRCLISRDLPGPVVPQDAVGHDRGSGGCRRERRPVVAGQGAVGEHRSRPLSGGDDRSVVLREIAVGEDGGCVVASFATGLNLDSGAAARDASRAKGEVPPEGGTGDGGRASVHKNACPVGGTVIDDEAVFDPARRRIQQVNPTATQVPQVVADLGAANGNG